MQPQNNIDYNKILMKISYLSDSEKKKLILDLQKSMSENKERKFGKYIGDGWISETFNDTPDEFQEFIS